MACRRLSRLMVEFGLAPSVAAAKAMIQAGRVEVNPRSYAYPEKTSRRRGSQGAKLCNLGWRAGDDRGQLWRIRPQDIRLIEADQR